jgi:hypothetical protein
VAGLLGADEAGATREEREGDGSAAGWPRAPPGGTRARALPLAHLHARLGITSGQ